MSSLSGIHVLPMTRAPDDRGDGDAALVAAAQRDPQAFAHLYVRYVDPVYRYCYRCLVTRETAEDATSLVFAKALAALPRYRADGPSFRSWLFAIAHNVIADTYRAGHPTRSVDAATAVMDRSPDPEAAALAADERSTVAALLAGMPPDQRQVLELRLAGLTTAEIATALGRRPGAVRATQFRAAARLRTLLGIAPHRKDIADE